MAPEPRSRPPRAVRNATPMRLPWTPGRERARGESSGGSVRADRASFLLPLLLGRSVRPEPSDEPLLERGATRSGELDFDGHVEAALRLGQAPELVRELQFQVQQTGTRSASVGRDVFARAWLRTEP